MTRPNILYLVHRVPYPPNRGDRIRSYRWLCELAESSNVYLGTLSDEPVEPGTWDVLRWRCADLAVVPTSPTRWIRAAGSMLRGRTATEGLFASARLRQQIDRWTQQIQFDAVVVYCSSMLQYVETPALADVPAVLDLVDVDSQKWLDYAAQTRGWKRTLWNLEGRRLRRREAALPKSVRSVALVSEKEAALYRRIAPGREVHAIANGVDTEYFHPGRHGSSRSDRRDANRCVFVGALDYRANVEGLLWYCENVWPEVRRQHATARLSLVGRQPVAAIRSLDKLPGIEVAGQVPDVRPYFAQSSFSIAPLLVARGLQNKILESFAMARTVIASPVVMEGLASTAQSHAVTAKGVESWIRATVELFQKPRAVVARGIAARRYVEHDYSWARQRQAFARLIERHRMPSRWVGAA